MSVTKILFSATQFLFGCVSLGVLCLAIGTIFGGNGCNRQELERRFEYTMEDGSFGTVNIEHKYNSVIKENKKFGSYYYIVEYFPSTEAISKAMAEISGEGPLPISDLEDLAKTTTSPERRRQIANELDALWAEASGINEQKIEARAQLDEKDLEEYARRAIAKNESYQSTVAFLKPEERPYFKRAYTEFQQLEVGVVTVAFYDQKGHSLLRNGYSTTFTPAAFVGHTYEANQIEGGYEWKGQFGESYITFENFCDIDSVKVEYIR